MFEKNAEDERVKRQDDLWQLTRNNPTILIRLFRDKTVNHNAASCTLSRNIGVYHVNIKHLSSFLEERRLFLPPPQMSHQKYQPLPSNPFAATIKRSVFSRGSYRWSWYTTSDATIKSTFRPRTSTSSASPQRSGAAWTRPPNLATVGAFASALKLRLSRTCGRSVTVTLAERVIAAAIRRRRFRIRARVCSSV
ncbi:hypothetical protein Bca52824_089991 [Brassica carinata]|uniref:Uncharacterized protein n=1 Tax=Brassica carinata TaxID=52824 RepID=A0A8X7TFG3_BRACI|nr:hypothetical protein Bca52824_089991 [Brassica carinata]